MEIKSSKIVLMCVMVLFCNDIFAKSNPPQPLGPVAPPDLPMDGNIISLVIVAIFLAFYKVTLQAKKTSQN